MRHRLKPYFRTLFALKMKEHTLLKAQVDLEIISLSIFLCFSSQSSSTLRLKMASLTPSEIQYQLNHASEDRSANVIAAVTTCLCLATIAVGFRILARRMMKTPLGADDWMIVTALVREYLHQLHTFEDTKIALHISSSSMLSMQPRP